MENMLIVPRELLQAAHDALEGIEDWSVAGTETYIIYKQLETYLYPDSAFVTPIQRMEST